MTGSGFKWERGAAGGTARARKAMSAVRALGYLGFYAADIAAWRRWATELLGLQEAARPDGVPADHLYLRMDERAWRFAVEPAATGGLAFTGWEVADHTQLAGLGDRLAAAGVQVTEDAALAERRQVDALLRCVDPSGYHLEFYCGAYVPEQPFLSPRGVRFVTGDLGLGHILQTVADIDATRHFYLDLLGFRMSDIIEFSGNRVHFTHVNPRHHSLAFVQARDGAPALGHFMVETDSLDFVGQALDLAHGGLGQVTETFGKHTNDHVLSFYMLNPSGSQAEYGYGGRLIDDATWTVSKYTATAYWGHKVPGSEYSASGPVSPRATAAAR